MLRQFYILFLFFYLSFQASAVSPVGHKRTFAQKDIFQSAVFLRNKGIINDRNNEHIEYYANKDNMHLYFTEHGLIYRLNDLDRKKIEERKKEKKKGKDDDGERTPMTISTVSVDWVGANPHPLIIPGERAKGYYTYLKKADKGYTTVTTSGYKTLTYKDVYPGIDVVYSFPDKGGIKYNLIVHPGADPGLIRMKYSGAIEGIKKCNDGNVTISTLSGDIVEHTPVCYTDDNASIASSFTLTGHDLQFTIDNTYDHTKTLTIDPWVVVLTQLVVRNLGVTVDYNLAGEVYVYGAGSDGVYDVTTYAKVAKFDPNGNFLWVFNGSVPSIGWNSAAGGGNYLSNAKVDKITGKVYVGIGYNYSGTQLIRLDSSGNYDNFETAQNQDFSEIWSFLYNCGTGSVLALGGGTTFYLNMGVINTNTAAITTTNFTTITGSYLQDIVSAAYDAVGNLYVVMASNGTPQISNTMFRVNAAYNNYIWNAPTGYQTLDEANNLPAFDPFNENSNNFNALAANANYLFYYDGYNLAAYNLATGAPVGTATTISGYSPLGQGGIAVDNCNHVYIGGRGVVKTFTFNGSSFAAGADISLGAGFTGDTVNDVRYNSSNNLLYVTGSEMLGTYNASLSITCIVDTNTFTSSVISTCQEAIVTVVPGLGLTNPAFSYSWEDGSGNVVRQTTPGTALIDTLTGMSPGNYTVHIQLNVECGGSSQVDSFTVVCSTLVVLPDTTVCAGQPVTLTASPTIPGGTYLWSPGGATTQSITVSPANTTTYTASYTPTSGPVLTGTATVTVVHPPTVSVNDTTVCLGIPATLTATPSQAGGTYSWSPGGATTQSITVSPASSTTYSVVYTASCGTGTDTGRVTITPDPTLSVANDTICPGDTGTLTAVSNPAGGTYSWSTGAITSSITASPASNTPYTVTYTVAGCGTATNSGSIIINQPPTVTFTASGPICVGQISSLQYTGNGSPLDSFNWNFDGGTIVSGSGEGPYQVKWSTSGTKNISLTVSVGTCVSASATLQVTVTPFPTITLPNYSICIHDSATLAPTVTPPGGTYSWNTGSISDSITVGPIITTHYTLTYTAGTCLTTYVDTVIVITPQAGPDRNVSCVIIPGGTATMAAHSTGTWTFWGGPGTAAITSPTSPTTTITNFTAQGTYSFIWTTDTAGCTDTANVNVTAKPNAGPNDTLSCIILPGGTAIMAASDTGIWTMQTGNPGTPIITDSASPTTTITDFSTGGTYHFIWTDTNTCTDTTSIFVTAKPNAGPDQVVVCAILPGGSATMAATGLGIWSAQAGNPGTATITAPTSPTTTITTYTAPGVYSFIWTNASGCTDTATVTVTQEPTISLPNTGYCLGDSTTLTPTVAPTGGTFLWTPTGAVTPSINVDTGVTSIFSVTYTLGTCQTSTSNTVTVFPLPLATVTTIPSVCTAGNGLAIANPSAGTPGYTYSWSPPGGTGDTLNLLSPNPYQVTVTDMHHCTVTASGTVGLQTPAVVVTEVSQHNLKCFNDATGDIYISSFDTARNSGAYIYTYAWSNTFNTPNLINVPAGPYTVTVTDQFGCSGTLSDTLTQPQALAASTTFTNPQCFGYANGTASVVNPTGGSGSYHYAWSTTPVQNTQQATGLPAGTYTVSFTDDSACLLTLTATLVNPLQITFASPAVIEPSCFGFSNGSILVTPQNGIGTYTYVWSTTPVQTTDSATGLPAGTYTVTATDSSGCTATQIIPVGQPTLLTVSVDSVNILCFGYNDGSDTATAAGGTPPYTYLWSTHDTTAVISNLFIGTYSVVATDNNACTASNYNTLTQPTQVTELRGSVRDSCPFTPTGQIFDTASGGVGSFIYSLDTNGTAVQPPNTTGIFTGLVAGLYTVIATDGNGCPVSDTITVQNAPFNYYTDTAISTSCYGTQYQDGIIHLQGYTIPNGPFQYSLDGGPLQFTPDFFNLAAGPHTILVQDNYGCDTTFTVVVAEPLPPNLQILPGDSTIFPGSTIQLTNVFGPYSPDSIKSYLWSPADGLNCTDCPSPLASPYARQTLYTLVVTYNQGCVDTAFIQINVNGEPPLYIPNAFTPNGDGTNDVWYVFGTGIKDIKIMIFDRWGEKVYESEDQFQGWDGRYRGQLESPGVFVYIVNVTYEDNKSITKQGSISLVR